MRLPVGQTTSVPDAARQAGTSPLLTGLPSMDREGGVQGGDLWAVSGPRGAGVSRLCAQIAVNAATVGQARTLYVNAHLRTAALVQSLIRNSRKYHRLKAVEERRLEDLAQELFDQSPLTIASWQQLPQRAARGESWSRAHDKAEWKFPGTWERPELVIYDTLAEVFPESWGLRHVGSDVHASVAEMKHALVETGSRAIVAVRLPWNRRVTEDKAEVRRLYWESPDAAALMHVADAHVFLEPPTQTDTETTLSLERRSGPSWRVPVAHSGGRWGEVTML